MKPQRHQTEIAKDHWVSRKTIRWRWWQYDFWMMRMS